MQLQQWTESSFGFNARIWIAYTSITAPFLFKYLKGRLDQHLPFWKQSHKSFLVQKQLLRQWRTPSFYEASLLHIFFSELKHITSHRIVLINVMLSYVQFLILSKSRFSTKRSFMIIMIEVLLLLLMSCNRKLKMKSKKG